MILQSEAWTVNTITFLGFNTGLLAGMLTASLIMDTIPAVKQHKREKKEIRLGVAKTQEQLEASSSNAPK